MLYNQHLLKGGIAVTFETHAEVQTVRIAFAEHNAYMGSIGNDSSVSTYQKVVAKWQGVPQQYCGTNHKPLVTKLQHLADETDRSVDAILDQHNDSSRLAKAAARYKLGQRAVRLVGSIELQAEMESDWSEVLGEQV